MANNKNIDHIDMNVITSKNSMKNGDDQSYLHTNGERSNLMTASQTDSNHDGRSNGNTTSSGHVSSNRRTPTTTDVSVVYFSFRISIRLLTA